MMAPSGFHLFFWLAADRLPLLFVLGLGHLCLQHQYSNKYNHQYISSSHQKFFFFGTMNDDVKRFFSGLLQK